MRSDNSGEQEKKGGSGREERGEREGGRGDEEGEERWGGIGERRRKGGEDVDRREGR